MVKTSRIMKVAGLSLVGFCAVSLAADKVALSPEASQLAGFCGAFLGALAGRGRPSLKQKSSGEAAENTQLPEKPAEEPIVPSELTL